MSYVRVRRWWNCESGVPGRRNRRRTITNQLVRRRDPTPHEFPAGWTIKSGRVWPTFLETNGETWINSVFVSPIPFPTPLQPLRVDASIDFFLFSFVDERTGRASVSRYESMRSEQRDVERERERKETTLHVSYDPIRLWPIYGVSYVLSRRNCFDPEKIDEKTEARGSRDDVAIIGSVELDDLSDILSLFAEGNKFCKFGIMETEMKLFRFRWKCLFRHLAE